MEDRREAIEPTEVISRLQREISDLITVQIEALKRATFLGMTPDEGKFYDARRQTITRLIQQLTEIQQVQ